MRSLLPATDEVEGLDPQEAVYDGMDDSEQFEEEGNAVYDSGFSEQTA